MTTPATYPVFVVLVGEGCTELVGQVGTASTMEQAIALVEREGYRVIPCEEGGCCELAEKEGDAFRSWSIRVHSLSSL